MSSLPVMIGRSLAVLSIVAMMGSATLQAQIGLASGSARIALIARVPPRASIAAVGPAQKPARFGNLREETVKVRLSANAGYRLMVVGNAPVSGTGAPLWVRAESGSFEEVRPGAPVTVLRGHHAAVEWEAEVTFRSEHSESVEGPHFIPVRYEVRIDPTI